MSNIILEFIYNGKKIKIPCNKDEYMNEIITRYSLKSNTVFNNHYFLYNGKKNRY